MIAAACIIASMVAQPAQIRDSAAIDNIGLSRGLDATQIIVQKFGSLQSAAIGDYVWSPSTDAGANGYYLTTASTLTVDSSGNDTSGGVGAQSVRVFCIDANWDLAQEDVTLNQASSPVTTMTCLRVYRAYVLTLGAYHGSNENLINITYTTGGAVAAQIAASAGQTQMTMYTIPRNYMAYIRGAHVYARTANSVDLEFRKACGIDDVTTPFQSASRVVLNLYGLADAYHWSPESPIEIGEQCDIWWEVSAVSGGAPAVSVDYEILLVKNGD